MKRVIALSMALVTVGLVIPALVIGATAEDAQAQQRRASLDEGPIVRRKLLFRSSRFELAPTVGMTLNDSYKRNVLFGLEANFYLTNEFGLGVSGLFSPLHPNTDLLDQVESTVGTETNANISYAVVTGLFDAHVAYVPIFGKFSLFRNVVDYDIHLVAGFGGALISAEGEAAGEAQFDGFKPGPVVGGGGRLFVRDSFAVSLDIKDYIYSTADSQTGATKPTSDLRDNFVVTLGFSFFLPGEVPISR